MRTIDADALKADLRQYFTDGVLDGISARLAFNQILHDIDNAPTVERPQGEWITKEHSIEYYCSLCGERLDQYCENFCCHCGADMRGGRE